MSDRSSITAERWEQGSNFHLLDYGASTEPATMPWRDEGVYLGSGRDALQLLLETTGQQRRWDRLWWPSYFCQEVVSVASATDIPIELYPASPWESPLSLAELPFRAGDAVLVMNYFGLGTYPEWLNSLQNIEVIEDHSHDPFSDWAWNSEADWCIASLRKTLPVPDGGVLWSPRGHDMPSSPDSTNRRNTASSHKLAAMHLKRLYLEGHPVDKEAFRSLELRGEEDISSGAVSGMPSWTQALLSTFPIDEWRTQRKANFERAVEQLAEVKELRILRVQSDESVPFSLVFRLCSREDRDEVRRQLISRRIYPAILWDLDDPAVEGIPTNQQKQAAQVLSLHCDMRYSSDDIDRVVRTLLRILETL